MIEDKIIGIPNQEKIPEFFIKGKLQIEQAGNRFVAKPFKHSIEFLVEKFRFHKLCFIGPQAAYIKYNTLISKKE